MAKIDHLDLETKHIYLTEGVREYHPVDNIYKEIRTLRATDDTLRGFDMPVTAMGNIAKGGGKYTPRLAIFCHGWKVVPEDVSHVLYVSGEQITSEGESGPACFDLEPLSASSKIIIQYEPPMAEVIEKGTSGLTEEESNRLMEVQAIKARTDNLPTDPSGMAALASAHGLGSWEGATTTQLWNHDDRRLTSRSIGLEAIASEAQVNEMKDPTDDGYNRAEHSLKKLSDKLNELLTKVTKVGASFKI